MLADSVVEVVIANRRGLHARAAAKVAALAETLPAQVSFTYEGQSVPALSIMGLMLLGAAMGATVTLSADGVDASQSVDTMADLVRSGFLERD